VEGILFFLLHWHQRKKDKVYHHQQEEFYLYVRKGGEPGLNLGGLARGEMDYVDGV